MPGVFHILLADTGGSVSCPHGGAFKGTLVSTVKFDGIVVCTTLGGFIPTATICPLNPAVPPFLPPCVLPLPAQSYITGLKSNGFVSEMALQSSVSNGMPSALPKSRSSDVIAL